MQTRSVGTLRLSAKREDLVRRGALLFEDALRTASLPSGPGRVLFVRQLDLGVIRADSPPSSVALLLEQKIRALLSSAEHGDEPGADRSNVVFFRDEVEPLVVLARRLARGESAMAWYFPRAAPGFVPTMSRDEALRLCLAGVIATSAGPAALVALVDALFVADALEPVLSALRWQEGPALLQAIGVTRADDPTRFSTDEATSAAPLLRSEKLRRTLTSWARAWGPGDARSVWLAAVALVLEAPARLGDARQGTRAAALAAKLAASRAAAEPRKDGEPGQAPEARSFGEITISARAAAARSDESKLEPVAQGVSRELASTEAPGAADAALKVEDVVAPIEPASFSPRAQGSPRLELMDPSEHAGNERSAPRQSFFLDTPLSTVVGGLFFLIPVLERVGIVTLLEAQPGLFDVGFPARFFSCVATRLGAPENDPVFTVLREGLVGANGDVLSEADIERLLLEVYRDVRRYCRRNLRLGLRDIVCRRGRIITTRTHWDITFDLEQADARVRRAGLDVDPGWVLWLGRVVRYHYVHGQEVMGW